jgi:hypothetical protein
MDDDKLDRIKSRLAVPREQVAKHATADDYVAVMYADMKASRQAGKTWKQIAEDFSPDVILSADSLRQAFDRRGKKKSRKQPNVQRGAMAKKAAAAEVMPPVTSPERPKVDLGVFATTRDSLSDLEGTLL